MADNEIRNPSKAYFKWKMPVITKSEDDWNFWNTDDKYNRTMFIGYNDTTTPPVASLFMIVDGKPMQAVGDDVIARIAGLETNTAQALADIQALIDRVNAQQGEISNLQQECQRILEDAESAVRAAQIWAEGTDAQVAEKGGEHSAKGWAQKANDIVAAGLPSDATFDHLTVTGSSKFGQDPDRANQPGLEIEGTGEIQAYRTVNMMNGATVSYDETVEMPWSDSSNKVPNTAWVQQAVQHGTIDPNTELTVKRISTSTGGAFLYAEHTNSNGYKKYAYLSIPKNSGDTTYYVSCIASDAADGTSSAVQVYPNFISVKGNSVAIEGAKSIWSSSKSVVEIGSLDTSTSDTRLACLGYTGCFQNGFFVGRELEPSDDGRPFKVMRTGTGLGSWEANFGVTPTVPDIADAADSSDKVPNTKWVQAAIAAGGGGGGSGAVTSVNGKTGEVVLSASDVGAASSSDLANYVTTDAMNTELTNYSTTAAIDAKLADYQHKLIAGDGIAISESNVISVTGGTGGGAVSSVNGKTGEVVLNATDVGAITGAEADTKITTALEPYAKTADVTAALEPYAKTADVTATLADYAKSADVTAEITAAVAPLATTEALNTGLAGKQDKLTAGSGIAISDTNVISSTVSSPVDSVNGKTGTVVLSGEDIRLHPTVGDYTYPAVSDVIDSISNYLPDGVSSDNKLVDNSSLSTQLATYQPKLTAGEGITISAENVISATGGSGGGAVTSVNGNTGAVVLTGDNIMTASDSTTSLNTALAGKQASITADTELTCKSVTTSYDSALNSINYAGNISFTGDSGNGSLGKITANELFINASGYYGTRIQASGITCTSGAGGTTWFNLNSSDKTISVDGTITATSPAVDANNNQVATTSWVKTALAGKQDSLTESSDLTVGSLTAGSADSGLYAGRYSVRFTSNGNDKLFVDATGPYVSNLTGGDLGPATGEFNWYINTTTDYNKFNVFNRYHVTDEATHEVTTNDSLVFSIGGSPDNHSTWIDFTVDYLSFKGNANFGEYGMSHNMNFNGPSTFNNEATFTQNVTLGHGESTVEGEGGTPTTTPASLVFVEGDMVASGNATFNKGLSASGTVHINNATFWREVSGGVIPGASYSYSTGAFDIGYLTSNDSGTSANRVTIVSDSRESNYGAVFNLPVTMSDASFKRTSTLAADDNSTEVPTTAWVQGAIAAKAATKPTLTYAEKAGEPTVTKIEQCNGGSLCTVMWTGYVSTATGHVYIDLPTEFASARIVSTQFTAHDTATAAPWTADASIAGGKIMLSVKSTAVSSSASATIVLYKA